MLGLQRSITKKLERLINVRNVDGSLNKEEPIEHTVEVNIYFKEHRKRTEINVIGRTKVDSNFGDTVASSSQPRN